MNKPLNKMAVQATINGESTAFLCSPGQVLAEVLRDELELIGTKIGCNPGLESPDLVLGAMAGANWV